MRPARNARTVACERPGDPLFGPLHDAIAEWRLPLEPFRDLLDAFAQDVTKTRYADYAELLDYCRRSANPVGRLLLHLVDCATPENLARSDAICSALQLANFWQDIAVDWRKDRVYLPPDDLEVLPFAPAAFNQPFEAHLLPTENTEPLRARRRSTVRVHSNTRTDGA